MGLDGPCGSARTRRWTGGASNYLNRIRHGAAQMHTLIEALLSLAQVSRAEVRKGSVDLSALARAVAAELAEQQPSKQVIVQVEPDLVCVGDERLLRQVFANLLSNAWKFAGEAPHVEVGSELTPSGETAVFVRDNGVGFDSASADKLFAAFQRFHSANDYPGTGIGLATVHRIVSRHGGKVWAQSAVGAGTAIFFTLPPRARAQ